MTDRWSRLAPLTGVLFGIIVVVAIVTGGGETPDANARPARVIAYYGTHRSEVETSAILFALAFLVLLLFAGVLRSYLRRTPAAEGLGSLALAGAVLMAVGALIGTGVEYGLAHQLHHLGPEVAQTLNFLDNELFLPVLAGAFVFGISSGLAILRGAALPKWLGWVAIVLGVVALIPPTGFFALLGFVIWTVIASILMYRRTGSPAETGVAVS
jgi:hypothetical protein